MSDTAMVDLLDGLVSQIAGYRDQHGMTTVQLVGCLEIIQERLYREFVNAKPERQFGDMAIGLSGHSTD